MDFDNTKSRGRVRRRLWADNSVKRSWWSCWIYRVTSSVTKSSEELLDSTVYTSKSARPEPFQDLCAIRSKQWQKWSWSLGVVNPLSVPLHHTLACAGWICSFVLRYLSSSFRCCCCVNRLAHFCDISWASSVRRWPLFVSVKNISGQNNKPQSS